MESLPIHPPPTTFALVLIGLALLGVAFFSSSEISLVALNPLRVRHRAEQGHKGAHAAQRIAARHDRFFAAILLTENALIIFASSLGTALLISLLGNRGESVALATAIMTLLIVIFGEITPKTLARQWADVWGLIVAPVVDLVIRLETPILLFFTVLPRLIQRLVGAPAASPFATEAELRLLTDILEEQGAVEKEEGEMLGRVLRLGDRPVREVMTPRTEVMGVEEGTTLQQFLSEVYARESHTRFPVFVDSLDHVTGILSIKDVLLALARGEISLNDPVTPLARPAFFAPETKRIGPLLAEMRERRTQMAIIVDEFGGTAGLVTLKRLVEEVVGPFRDELEAEAPLETLDEHTFQMAGSLHVDRAREEMALDLPDGPYETVAGFILHQLGRIPKEGDQVRYGPWRFVVTEMDGLRIERVLVTRS